MAAREAAALDEEAAAEVLDRTRSRDTELLAELPSGAWFPQVSSKCAPLTAADLGDFTGGDAFTEYRDGVAQQYPPGIGYPDGSAEQYPMGIGSPMVLAYHQAMRERFGPSTVLVLPADVGSSTAPAVCQGQPIWITLWTQNPLPDADAALAWCEAELLPADECAARRFNPGGESAFVLRER